MKKLIRVICLTMCALVFGISCSSDKNHRYSDDFYNLDYFAEYSYVPLVKPYRIEYITEGYSQLNFVNATIPGYYKLGLQDVKHISIQGRIILIYHPHRNEGGGGPNPFYKWFILKPDTKEEIGFETESEFTEQLIKDNLKKPDWLKVDVVWEEYSKTGYLPWEFLKELEE